MITITEGIKSLGIVIDSEATKLAVLQESKVALCKLNAQYEFLLNSLVTQIARSEISSIDPKLFETLKVKNQAMQDVLSVSRHIIEMKVGEKMSEGFLGTAADPFASFKEAFQEMDDTVANNKAMIQSGQYMVAQDRTLNVSVEKNQYAERLTNMYGLLNVTAIGLLFYIMYTN